MKISNKLWLCFVFVLMGLFAVCRDKSADEDETPIVNNVNTPAVTGVSVFLLAEYVDPWEGAVVIEQGQSETFYAEVSGEYFPAQDQTWREVSWSIIGDGADEIELEFAAIIIGKAVVFTVPDSAKQGGTFILRATAKFDEKIYGEAQITVGIPEITGIRIMNDRDVVAAGQSIPFDLMFTGTGKIASQQPLSWEITERVSFENSADEGKGYKVAAETKIEDNTLIVDQQEKYGVILVSCTILGTNYSATALVTINETGTFSRPGPRD
jgi:hypothetical protein